MQRFRKDMYKAVKGPSTRPIVLSVISGSYLRRRQKHCVCRRTKTFEFALTNWQKEDQDGFGGIISGWEEIFANGPISAFFNDFEIFNGPFLIILHRLWWAIFQINGTMAHGPLPSQSLYNRTYTHYMYIAKVLQVRSHFEKKKCKSICSHIWLKFRLSSIVTLFK